jgi:hypothetical protein
MLFLGATVIIMSLLFFSGYIIQPQFPQRIKPEKNKLLLFPLLVSALHHAY